jgi:hypothetical protein
MRASLRIGLIGIALLFPNVARGAGVEQLRWLAGCWASELRDAGSGEHWMPPAGGTMLGVSRTVSGDRTVAYEFLRIAETAPGQLAYIALPSGQQEAAFALLRSGEGEVVFENLEHDFPQRVIYRLEGDRLRARIEGSHQGQNKSIEFPFRRVACEPAPEVPAPASPESSGG